MQDPLLGKQLANFRIDSLLGKGGMARVYYGVDVTLQRPVAVKILSEALRDEEDYNRRFVDEARMVATWRHPNIIQVYYAGAEDGLAYFAMEYVDGSSLDQRLAELAAQGAKMPHDEVLEIGWAVANALDYAHARGVIHRDIKPGNVLLARDGRVVLTDFGLALDTAQGSLGKVFGSPHYISPEQARRSADAVPQSDLYSMGVMLFEMLAGQLPFDDPSGTSVAVMHISEEPPRPTIYNPALNVATEQVLLKALRKHPTDRYQTGADLMASLESALQGKPIPQALPAPLPIAAQRRIDADPFPSIAEQVALEFDTGANTVTEPPTQVTNGNMAEARRLPSEEPVDWRSYLWMMIAAVPIVLTIIGFGLVIYSDQVDDRINATRAAGEIDPLPTDITPSATAILTATPTTQPTFTPTDTPVPSETPTPLPTSEAGDAAAVLPTATEPAGELLRIRYNLDSLYVWNNTGAGRRVARLGFLGYDASGNSAGSPFDGNTWREIAGYDFVDPDRCVQITLVNPRVPPLNPVDCTAATASFFYNAVETLSRTDPRRFWSADGITEFGVFWDGIEVTRCDVTAGLCDVYIEP